MMHVDLGLARRLEGIEAHCGAEFVRARLRARPGADAEAVAVAGDYACRLGGDSPMNDAKGLGLAGPVDEVELEAMERVYFARGARSRVVVCPLADRSLVDGLALRGYRLDGFEDVLCRAMGRPEGLPTAPPGIETAPVGPGEVALWARTLVGGFAAPADPDPGFLEIFEGSAGSSGLIGLLARVEGEPAGAASLMVRDGLALLAGASTLPAFRHRGVQTALCLARMALASAAGCDLLMMASAPGSGSRRNAERLGFRTAYTRPVLVRDPP